MTLYDELADEYDDVTDQGRRVAAAAKFVEKLTSRQAIRSAVDAACGTGLYALALAEVGVDTVGVDISAKMLQQARRHGEDASLSVKWVESPMQELASRLPPTHDAVLCMGNSLPHLLDDDDLNAALSAFRAVLAPGGVVVIHVLNYDRILAEGQRIVGVTGQGDRQYVRFYDFLEGRVRFNVLRLDWHGEQCDHSLHSTVLRPYGHNELCSALTCHGFGHIAAHSDLQFGPFEADTSDSLLITASV